MKYKGETIKGWAYVTRGKKVGTIVIDRLAKAFNLGPRKTDFVESKNTIPVTIRITPRPATKGRR